MPPFVYVYGGLVKMIVFFYGSCSAMLFFEWHIVTNDAPGHNRLKPGYQVVSTCHQDRCMHWGQPTTLCVRQTIVNSINFVCRDIRQNKWLLQKLYSHHFMYTNLQVYEFRYSIKIFYLKIAPSIIMFSSMRVAPHTIPYSSGILSKHVFPGGIHQS